MKALYTSVLTAMLAVTSVSFAQAQPAASMVNGVLVNAQGMTLYSFDKDVPNSGTSMCQGACLSLWPAASASADAKPEGSLTLIKREDGSQQWAYQGKPLYTYSLDKKPGDTLGDKVKDVWHVIR